MVILNNAKKLSKKLVKFIEFLDILLLGIILLNKSSPKIEKIYKNIKNIPNTELTLGSIDNILANVLEIILNSLKCLKIRFLKHMFYLKII